MGCGNSKKAEPPPERRIRITEAKEHAKPATDNIASEAVSPPRSTIMSTGRSAQDGLMAEQESFAKSLPSESRSILNATMANMLDMGQANISPSDFADRDQHFQNFNEEMPMEKPAIPALSIKSLGNTRKLTTEESEQLLAITTKLSDALNAVQIQSDQPFIQPFLPTPP